MSAVVPIMGVGNGHERGWWEGEEKWRWGWGWGESHASNLLSIQYMSSTLVSVPVLWYCTE
jgi:hypothetical protein